MPLIQISILPQTAEKKAEIAKTITDEMHRMTNIPKEAMIVIFQEYPAESFATGGELLSEQFKKRQ